MNEGATMGRLLLASSFPLLAFALQWLFWGALQPYVWVFFYPAVFFSSWVGGKGAGVLATAFASLTVCYFFMPPRYSFALDHSASALSVAIFTAMGLLISLSHERMRRAYREAGRALATVRVASDRLDERVGERTGELQSMVEELRRKEAELSKAQELAKIGSWSYKIDGTLTWSDQLYRIYGFDPGAFVPDRERFLSIILPEDRQAMQKWTEACLTGECPGELQFRMARPDGTLRFISGRGEVVRDASGNLAGMAGTAQDITQRVESEAALRESEERLRLFIEYAPVPLAMFDREMRYLYASRRWRSDYGLGEEDLSGRSHYEVFPEIPERWKELHRRGLAGETLSAEADPLEREEGTVQWLRWEIRPWYRKPGEVGGILIFSEDVTERRRAAEELQRLNEELELRVAQRTEALDEMLARQELQHAELQHAYGELEAQTAERIRILTELRNKDQVLIHQSRLAAMGEMLGYIAHQWRQPLNVLGLNLQVLGLSYKHGTFSEELLDESVGKAMGIIQHLSRTIDDFRDFLVLNKEKSTFCIGEVVYKTVGLIREKLEREGITIGIETSGEPRTDGFPNEYGQVILNLLSNARDALMEKQVANPHISIRSFVAGKSAVVTVTDNAGGINEEIMDKIFDAYFTTKALGKGSGVGLFMSKMIIEKNMGGRLAVRNVDGGAEFTIETAQSAVGEEVNHA